jgi:hypothetical protein
LNDCWPAFNHGAILITTRHRTVTSQPIGTGLEIKEFSIEDGAKLLVHLLQNKVPSSGEGDAAVELSTLLNGYALAISQMSPSINSHAMRIKDFLALYKRYPKGCIEKGSLVGNTLDTTMLWTQFGIDLSKRSMNLRLIAWLYRAFWPPNPFWWIYLEPQKI